VIDDEVIAATIESYPVLWEDPAADPQVCFIGCPHLSLNQLYMWTDNISAALDTAGKKTVALQTILTAAPDVVSKFSDDANAYNALTATGVSLSSICPLLYMHNPLCEKQAVITNSNKLRTYTPARYLTDSAILSTIVTGGISHG
jgi:predicted aconitase